MSDVKWIKIVVDIFDDEKIKIIETLPSADTIIVIWFKLLCLAGKTNSGGLLMMSDRIPYTDEMLAAIFRRNVSDVRMALEVFEKFGMIEIIDNTYSIPNWDKHQSLGYYEKKKQYDREYRKQKREEQKKLIEEKEEKSRTTVVRQSDDLSYSSSLSYSFIDHKNIDNYRHLLNTDNYNLKDYILNNNRLYRSIEEWMEYKDERTPKKANHYTEKGMKVLLTEIVKWHKKYGDEAVEGTINHTIANQWQGIVWDWMKKEFSQLSACVEETPQQINADRPERFRTCPDDTWKKLKQFVYDDGSFDWAGFNPLLLNDADRKWMRDNNM